MTANGERCLETVRPATKSGYGRAGPQVLGFRAVGEPGTGPRAGLVAAFVAVLAAMALPAALAAAPRRLAERLRLLYDQGPTDPMAVLVGATSVDDAINGIENLHRVAGLDQRVIDAAKHARDHLLAATRRLATEEAQARETEAATAA